MIRAMLAFAALLAATGAASAATTLVTFKGGLIVTSTSGCQDWNPNGQFFQGTYELPVGGSPAGYYSSLNLLNPSGSAEGFQRSNDVFTTVYKAVTAMHVYTSINSFSAYLKINSQSPAVISTATQSVTLTGSIKNWGQDADCIVNFRMALVKDLRLNR